MNIGVTTLLFLLFLGLKLSGYIAWGWIWVTAPLWIPMVFAILLLSVLGLVATVKVLGS